MKEKLRNKFLTFVNYEWDRGYRENIEDVAYENAVLTWNGMFIMVVVDVVLMLYYATTGHDSMQAIRYACTLPVIFVISVQKQI